MIKAGEYRFKPGDRVVWSGGAYQRNFGRKGTVLGWIKPHDSVIMVLLDDAQSAFPAYWKDFTLIPLLQALAEEA